MQQNIPIFCFFFNVRFFAANGYPSLENSSGLKSPVKQMRISATPVSGAP